MAGSLLHPSSIIHHHHQLIINFVVIINIISTESVLLTTPSSTSIPLYTYYMLALLFILSRIDCVSRKKWKLKWIQRSAMPMRRSAAWFSLLDNLTYHIFTCIFSSNLRFPTPTWTPSMLSLASHCWEILGWSSSSVQRRNLEIR